VCEDWRQLTIHLQLVTKTENACRHTFHARVKLRSNIKKKLQIIKQINPYNGKYKFRAHRQKFKRYQPGGIGRKKR
jgi:hypothetical protein